jgi:hypothetical protein
MMVPTNTPRYARHAASRAVLRMRPQAIPGGASQ